MLTQTLAEFVVSTPVACIPDVVLQRSEAGMIDTLGCALAGLAEQVTQLAITAVRENGTSQHATIWGTTERASPADAAFINAIAAHALDFDDNLPSLRGHPSTTIVPAVLSVAEKRGASGRDVLAAYAVGVEIAGKVGRAMGFGHYARGWHPTATVGVVAATAAVARLCGLNRTQLSVAWGIAASQASGLVMNFGTMTKPYHAGHAARCAVAAVTFAQLGLTSAAAIFDGEKNFVSIFGGDGEPLVDQIGRLGSPWEIVDPGLYVKRWPCCYCSHRPISALLELVRRHEIKPSEVEEIAIGFPPGSDSGLLDELPTTGVGGKFSIEYTAAALVLDRAVVLHSFTDAMVRRAEAVSLMQKVRRYKISDSRTWSATTGYNHVAIRTSRGRFESRIDVTPGSAEAPLDPAALDSKFNDCAATALGKEQAAHALHLYRTLRNVEDIRAATRLLGR